MDTNVTPPNSHPKRELDLYPYLAGRRDIFVDFEAASELGFKQMAFQEILEAGIGPERFPTRASGRFWFDRWHLGMYAQWLLKEATLEDYRAIAESVRRHDTIREFIHLYDYPPRDMVLRALYEWRGGRTRTRRLKIVMGQ